MFWGEKRYYSVDYYLKQAFGEKVYRLALNGGMTCPNRDGTLGSRGCIFCSAAGSGDFAQDGCAPIPEQLAAAKGQLRNKRNCRKFIAYFQAYTNTYAPVEKLRKLFMDAIKDPDVVILSIATRPDCLSGEVLKLLEGLNRIKPVWVELGLQTVHSETSRFIRSGFTLECFHQAVFQLHQRGIPSIVHVILGLPGESGAQMLETVSHVGRLPVFGIKLQLLHVLSGTDLGTLYRERPFPLFTQEEYCEMVCRCLELLPPSITIHRLTGDGPKELLMAPLWSRAKRSVLNQIHQTLKEQDTWQGKYF
ncbi:TIGR01212 family radical SAM protein [Lachnospiraceae bacterium JLR.KK009]|jgi:radical SAM protein (TIGR01212 family)|nr:TIGR01212 family radical SAM protein [Lachnospiraceae bacterium A2]MCI8706323.1 TIGR01212 family radical SAM protein [Lachnospiraceae bacterium]MCI8883317.1 TIGR01212 family radical SAM protein [Lachnospiraceae bacterium]